MKWYSGSSSPPKGAYFNFKMWEFVFIDSNITTRLPGKSEDKYMRLPAWLLLLTAPIGGISLVIFIPLVGIIGIIYYFISLVKSWFGKPTSKSSSSF